MIDRRKDLKYGFEIEDKILSYLNNNVDKTIIKTEPYHSYDYFCEKSNTYYELKSRRNNHDKYPDTMVGHNKLRWAKEHQDFNYVFLFNFTDGLYYHNYNNSKDYDVRVAGRCDRGQPELNKYFFIKKDDLLKF
jgi:hypothetical protein